MVAIFPASTKGGGVCFAFPDVCLTPAPPAPPIPIPYPNIGQVSSASKTDAGPDVSANDPLYQALRTWRLDRSQADGVPAFTLFSDRTLRELVAQKPVSRVALLEIWGLGETRVDRFGEDVLAVIAGG
jgi:superfamily II DNA helicase RecQ